MKVKITENESDGTLSAGPRNVRERPRLPISPTLRSLSVASVFVLCGAFSGCRFGAAPEAPIDAVAYPGFSPNAVTTLTVSRAFPGETAWTLRFHRVPGVPVDREWVIDGAPTPIADHLANGSFLRHLIETLATLQATENPSEDLPERYGLRPERGRIEWTSEHATEQTTGSFLIGDSIGGTRRYGKFRPDAASQIFAGAVLQMIEVPPRWDTLREQRFFLRPLDDFDIVRIQTPRTEVTYEREGTEWRKADPAADAKRASAKPAVSAKGPRTANSKASKSSQAKSEAERSAALPALLDRLFHFRIRNFIDDPGLQKVFASASELASSFIATIRLRDRADAETVIQVFRTDSAAPDSILFRSSERDGIVFETFPELVEVVNALASGGSSSAAVEKKK